MIRALLVDDHPGVRRAVRRLLEQGGDVKVVGEAGDGKEALDALDKLDLDVVLLDVNMPVMDGLTMLKKLGERSHDFKVVVLTMYGDAEIKARAFAAGAHALVSKQSAYIELLPTIRKLVEA